MSRGGDIQELLDGRQRELEQADDKDLVFDTDPRQVTGAGISQDVATGNQPADASDDSTDGANSSTSAEADTSGSMGTDPQAADGSAPS